MPHAACRRYESILSVDSTTKSLASPRPRVPLVALRSREYTTLQAYPPMAMDLTVTADRTEMGANAEEYALGSGVPVRRSGVTTGERCR